MFSCRLALSFSSKQEPFQELEQNYKEFEEQRLPGGLFEANSDGSKGGPNIDIIERSQVCLYVICFSSFHFLFKSQKLFQEKAEWGEWKLMKDTQPRDIRFETFWMNQLTQISQWPAPDWKREKQKRAERSQSFLFCVTLSILLTFFALSKLSTALTAGLYIGILFLVLIVQKDATFSLENQQVKSPQIPYLKITSTLFKMI